MFNSKKLTVFTAASLVAATSLVGCATLFRGSHDSVSLNSQPSGAKVYVDGMEMGSTPLQIPLVAKKDHTIEFRKSGYSKTTKVLSSSLGAGWVVLDILGGLVPIVVDAATGSWNGLEDSNVNVVLDKS